MPTKFRAIQDQDYGGRTFACRDPGGKPLAVFEDARLNGRERMMGDDYTIADIATIGWVRNLITFYGARELVTFDNLGQVPAWLDQALARPAAQRGLHIPERI